MCDNACDCHNVMIILVCFGLRFSTGIKIMVPYLKWNHWILQTSPHAYINSDVEYNICLLMFRRRNIHWNICKSRIRTQDFVNTIINIPCVILFK